MHGVANRTASSNASVAVTAVHHPDPDRVLAKSKRTSSNPVDIPLNRLSNAC